MLGLDLWRCECLCFVFCFFFFGVYFFFGGVGFADGLGVVLVLYLRDCWFGGMIGRIRLVGGRVMRERDERLGGTW